MLRRLLLIGATLGLLAGGGLILWVINLKLPDFRALESRLVTESTRIYDRTGKILLYNAEEEVQRRVVPANEISKDLKNATVAIEDDQFYEHRGVKFDAMVRAFFVNLGAGTIRQGGSTITQQLIKNSLLTQERKFTRKIKEIFLALKLEQIMTKEEILGWYLNEAPYGGRLYGAEEAAQTFFNHSARELSLAEAAYLAAIPKAPTYYSPYGNRRDELEKRKNLVLERMLQLQFITRDEYQTAKAQTIQFQPLSKFGIKAPHFVMWVLEELENRYGRQTIRNRGFKVITTLDWERQQLAEAAVAAYAETNEKNFNAKNAGLVALDPKTGQVLAMVGSRNYFDQSRDGNFNVTLAHRQPGSSFKPFVYATAFNKGFTPETMLYDLPTQFDTTCQFNPANCYTPVNYDGRYRGPISLRHALAQSINIPAIKLLYLAGLTDSVQTARRLGIQSLGDPNRYGLTLVLGGGEVSPLDMASAYGVFANDGVRNPYAKIISIEDRQGTVLEQFTLKSQRVLPENTARLISNILSDNEARAPMFGANSPLTFRDRAVAVKTGTTNDYRDAWIIGYTPSLVTSAWVGNNDNSPMEKKVSGLVISPMWRQFFASAIESQPVEKFPPPEKTPADLPPVFRGFADGGVSYYVDKISGKLATADTPANLKQERVLRQIHSILYWLDRENDPQFNFWEMPIRQWALGQGIVEQTENDIPQETDDIHGPEFAPEVEIVSPEPTDRYRIGEKINITLDSQPSRFPITRVDFFFNNHFLGSSRQPPFSFSIAPENLTEIIQDTNELKIVVYDAVENQTTVTTNVRID